MHKPRTAANGPTDRPASPPPAAQVARHYGAPQPSPDKAKEVGGPSGPEPTRYGDWERKGICYDF